MFFKVAVVSLLAYLALFPPLVVTPMAAAPPPPANVVPPPAPPVVVVPTTASAIRVVDVRRSDLEETAKIARSARIVPTLRHGRPSGVKVYAIRPGSPLEAIGVENGDTVLAINDVPIDRPDAAFTLYHARDELDHFDLDLERKGERVRIVVLVH